MRLAVIDTDRISESYRERAIDLTGRRLLITRFTGSEQEQDLTEPANCSGFGRVRHFRRGGAGWPRNPLPIEPAARALGLPGGAELRAQVFQNAVCNWRCWYCFVDFKLLSANRKFSDWLDVDRMLDLYLAEPNRPPVIDLTGGQPDLTPEWVPWTMRALRERGLDRSVYLWSDDNLSNDYFWRYLTPADRAMVAGYPMYGRVCCFKGFDAESFAFNTAAAPALFDRQFELFGRLLGTGVDLYAYVTLTCERTAGLAEKMSAFVDRLQALHPNLPLRTVPLEVRVFTPVRGRMDDARRAAIENQYDAVRAWQEQLAARFGSRAVERTVTDVQLGGVTR